MTKLPNLAGVATQNLVEQIGGSYSASYINWSRTMHLLRENAEGWLPKLVPNADCDILHRSPVGAYLLISFVNMEGHETPAVPQAIMDKKNNAIPCDRITARDVTDTHVRGICKAAALTFGLAYELWAKMPLESGYHDDSQEVISAEDFAALTALLDETNSDKEKFCKVFGIDSVNKLIKADYTKAVAMLEKKKGAKQ